MRLLLIDDHEDLRTGMKKYLEMAGHRVLCAADGQQAMETLGAFTFDAMILDLMMPKMDGLGFLKQLREDSKHANTPVLVHTANVSPKARETATSLGVQAFVSKGPGSWEQVKEALNGVEGVKAG